MTAVRSVGVVGSGGIAPVHVWAWRRLGLDVVVRSTNRESATVLATQFGATTVDDLDALLAVVDVVDVCTPTPSHPGIVAAAAAAGLPVVCEKPLALTRVEAEAMAATCADAGVALFPAHVVRYFPAYLAAAQAVGSGRIGRLTELRLSRRSAAPERPWFADRARSGGIVMDQLIHDIDYSRWVAGDVVTAQASIEDGPLRPQQRAVVTLHHAGGAVSHLAGEWGGPDVAFATTFVLTGTHGTIGDRSGGEDTGDTDHTGDTRDTGDTAGGAADGEGGGVLPAWQSDDSPYLAQAAEFLAALRGGPAPRVSAADGVAAVAIAQAANLSASAGRPVSVPDPSGRVPHGGQ